MRIPKHWAQVEVPLYYDRGNHHHVRMYGWSNRSALDAEAHARARAAKVGRITWQGVSNAWYLYNDRPLREPVLADYSEGDSNVLVTRSRYGAKVLNTDQVVFADIDVYIENNMTSTYVGKPGFLAKLFGKEDPIVAAERKLREWFSVNPRVGMRLYRTPNGFRGIFTHRKIGPASAEAQSLLGELGTDSLYLKLCKTQECYRARLTAKPWRIGAPVLSGAYPYTFKATEKEREECKRYDLETAEAYDAQAADYAACEFVEHLGNTSIDRETARVAELHDKLSGALSGKPLA